MTDRVHSRAQRAETRRGQGLRRVAGYPEWARLVDGLTETEAEELHETIAEALEAEWPEEGRKIAEFVREQQRKKLATYRSPAEYASEHAKRERSPRRCPSSRRSRGRS